MTDEPPELVDKFVAQFKPTYPIVSLKSGDFESFLGVRGFPHKAVIAPDGTLLANDRAGVPSALSKAMSKAKKGSMWPKSLAKQAKLLQAGDYVKAYAATLKAIEGGKLPEGDVATAELFKTYVEDLGTTALDTGRAALDEGFVYRAATGVEYWAAAKPPVPVTEDCRRLLAELEALPDYKKEMKGGEIFAEAKALEDEMEYLDAAKAYKSILKKCADTKIAGHARTTAEELIKKGMIGFSSACQTCRKAGKACAKHAEDFKL